MPQRASGFTLIELLIVITILGILSALGTYSYTNAQVKARDSQRKSDLANIKEALELARLDSANRSYPICDSGSLCAIVDTSTNPDLAPTYISKVPQDPNSGGSGGIYSYVPTCANGICQNYFLAACLENKQDQQRDQPTGYGCPKASYTLKSP